MARFSLFSLLFLIGVDYLAPQQVVAQKSQLPLSAASQKVSLSFQEIDLRRSLAAMAELGGVDIVVSDEVSGTATLQLTDVTWRVAFLTLLESKKLGWRAIDEVILVAPRATIAAQAQQVLANAEKVAALQPTVTAVIPIRYMRAEALLPILRAKSGGTLTPRGFVAADLRTNQLVITDVNQSIENARRLVDQLDIALRQVQIEARIVTLSRSSIDQLGVRWQQGDLNDINSSQAPAPAPETQTNSKNTPAPPVSTPSASNSAPGFSANLAVNVPGATKFGFRVQSNTRFLDLELSALARKGRAQVIARPKLITADRAPAWIESGVEIPYQEVSRSGATTVTFKDAVLRLEVVPQITPDNRLILRLHIKQDTVGQIYAGTPSINTNEMESEVVIDDGQTLVLGGIFQTDFNTSLLQTPGLSRLPLLGRLFRRTQERDDRQKLVIFITPKILPD